MSEDLSVAVGDIDRGAKKKNKNLSSRERQKIIRYSDHFENIEFDKPCNHQHNSTFQCDEINNEDIKAMRQKLYIDKNKIKQDVKVSHMLLVCTPQRQRCRKELGKAHDLRVIYKVRKVDQQHSVTVCQKFFLKATGFSQRRVLTIANNIKKGTGIKENRGGDRRSTKSVSKRQAVTKFIQNLRGRESHYTRNKSKRIYLSCDLNVTRLWNMYNNQHNSLKVNYKFFSRIFQYKFNIGFGSPATDTCSYCVRRKNEIKVTEDSRCKNELITDLRIHKLRAKQFYAHMKEVKTGRTGEIGYCFDLQQVQALPKLPIQEAYYSRQLSFYSLCICDLDGKTPQFYTWLENEAKRGPNEISSALGNFLSNQDFEGITTVNLFADGCGGQNKNSHTVHALMLWLANDAPDNVTDIILYFPVRGHSFLPADRVFGRVEKALRKMDVILNKEQYWDVYSQFGTVRNIGSDWNLLDIKGVSVGLKKLPGIREYKRIFIKKFETNRKISVKVKGLPYYRNDDSSNFVSLSKKFSSLHRLRPKPITLGRALSKEKLGDIKKLVESFGGREWEKVEGLGWLNTVVNGEPKGENEMENEENCDCEEDDLGVKL